MQVIISGENKAGPALQAVSKGLGAVGKEAEHTTSLLGRFGSGLGSLTRGLGQLGMGVFGIQQLAQGVSGLASSMVRGNAEFERYEVQFGVLLKSADKARERLKMLADFGARTPFELPELVRADKVLTAFGLHSQDTARRFGVSGEQILETIGDVASGTGASFEELSVTFGKFASGATGEAIARFQELGIATREEMTRWGLEFSKTGQLLSPVDEAFTVLEQNVRAKFGGMMAAQSTTFEGMVSNLQDWIGQAQRAIMAPVFDVLKDSLKELLDLLNSQQAKQALDSIARGLAYGVGSAVETIKWLGREVRAVLEYLHPENKRDLMAEWFGPDWGPRIDEAVRAIKGIGDTVGQVATKIREGDLGGAFASALSGIGNLGDRLAPLAGQLTRELGKVWASIDWGAVWGSISSAAMTAWTVTKNIATEVTTWLAGQWAAIQWDKVWAAISSAAMTAWTVTKDITGEVTTWLAGQWAAIRWDRVWGAITDFASGLASTVARMANAVSEEWTKYWAGKELVVPGTVKVNLASVTVDFRPLLQSIVDFFSGLPAKFRELADQVLATDLNDIFGRIGNAIGMAILAPLSGTGAGSVWDPRAVLAGPKWFAENLLSQAEVIAAAIIAGQDLALDMQSGMIGPFHKPDQGLQQSVRNWLQLSLVQPAREELGAKSPSTVFAALGQDVALGFWEGLSSELGNTKNLLVNKLGNLADAAMKAAEEIGTGVVTGIEAGLDERWPWLQQKLGDLVGRLIRDAKKQLGEGSPSKVFEQIGEWIVAGLSNGLDELGSVSEKMGRFLRDMTGDVANAAEQMGRALSGMWEQTFGMDRFRGLGSAGDAARAIGEWLGKYGGSVAAPGMADWFKRMGADFDYYAGQADVVNQAQAFLEAYEAMGMTVTPEITDSLRELADTLAGPFHDAIEALISPGREAARGMQALLEEMQLGRQIAEAAKAYAGLGMALPQTFLDLLTNLPHLEGGILEKIIAAILGGTEIPEFARGGVVPGPIDQPRLIVAHGGETVSRGPQTVINYSPTVYANEAPSIVSDWSMLRALAGV